LVRIEAPDSNASDIEHGVVFVPRKDSEEELDTKRLRLQDEAQAVQQKQRLLQHRESQIKAHEHLVEELQARIEELRSFLFATIFQGKAGGCRGGIL